jgi:hypothetical protein
MRGKCLGVIRRFQYGLDHSLIALKSVEARFFILGSVSASARIDSTDSGAEKGMVSLLVMRPNFASSSPVSGGFFGPALILMANGVPDSAKPWLARSLSAALPERALARLRKLLVAVPAAAETGPQR